MALLNLIASGLYCETVLQQQKNLFNSESTSTLSSLVKVGIYILKAVLRHSKHRCCLVLLIDLRPELLIILLYSSDTHQDQNTVRALHVCSCFGLLQCSLVPELLENQSCLTGLCSPGLLAAAVPASMLAVHEKEMLYSLHSDQ